MFGPGSGSVAQIRRQNTDIGATPAGARHESSGRSAGDAARKSGLRRSIKVIADLRGTGRHMSMRRLFLEVRGTAAIVRDLGTGLFVRNGLGLVMGEQLLLALRLPRLGRALDVPVVVVGRRAHRPGAVLSAGVVVRAVDVDHPVLVALRAALVPCAQGVEHDIDVDLLARRLLLPARVAFASVDDAVATLRPVLDGDGAIDVGLGFVRGDRLALDVVVGASALVTAVPVVVRGIRIVDEDALTVVGPADDDARDALRALCGVDDPLRGAAINAPSGGPWIPPAQARGAPRANA
jgi:hypothetical protein